MGLRFRKRIKFGPFAWNFSWSSGKGLQRSRSFKAGPFSKNSRNKGWRIDLPFGAHYAPGAKSRRRVPAGTTQAWYENQEAKRQRRQGGVQKPPKYGGGSVPVRGHTRGGRPVRSHTRHVR